MKALKKNAGKTKKNALFQVYWFNVYCLLIQIIEFTFITLRLKIMSYDWLVYLSQMITNHKEEIKTYGYEWRL